MGVTPVGLKLSVIDRMFKKKMDAKAGELNMTSVQLRVLGEISRMESDGVEEIHQRDLEKAEQVTHPTMTDILKRLESKGMITCTISGTDRRSKKISCTEKSKGIHKEIEKMDEETLDEICADMSDEQKKEFLKLLDLVIGSML